MAETFKEESFRIEREQCYLGVLKIQKIIEYMDRLQVKAENEELSYKDYLISIGVSLDTLHSEIDDLQTIMDHGGNLNG